MAVEIREVVLTARVVEPPPAAAESPVATEALRREIVRTCLAEVRRYLERRAER